MRALHFPALLVVFVLLFADQAFATSVRPPAFSALVSRSDCVVRAIVTSVRCERSVPGSKIIHTKVGLNVTEVVAGSAPVALELRVLGGRIGSESLVLEGAPRFVEGDETILFVQGNGRQAVPLTGMMYGYFGIRRDAASGRSYVVRNDETAVQRTSELIQPLQDGVGAPRPVRSLETALSPDAFISEIRALAAGNSRTK